MSTHEKKLIKSWPILVILYVKSRHFFIAHGVQLDNRVKPLWHNSKCTSQCEDRNTSYHYSLLLKTHSFFHVSYDTLELSDNSTGVLVGRWLFCIQYLSCLVKFWCMHGLGVGLMSGKNWPLVADEVVEFEK